MTTRSISAERSMMLLMNIGLRSQSIGVITAEHVMQTLERQGFNVIDYATHDSNTEPTLVAEVEYPPNQGEATAIYALAELLGQDCIAVQSDDGGELIGPNAAAWGDFNPAFFLQLDGVVA